MDQDLALGRVGWVGKGRGCTSEEVSRILRETVTLVSRIARELGSRAARVTDCPRLSSAPHERFGAHEVHPGPAPGLPAGTGGSVSTRDAGGRAQPEVTLGTVTSERGGRSRGGRERRSPWRRASLPVWSRMFAGRV
ncbi:hypothetical protein NDU88_008015 [Pleurodeles waltl]|uniref:Uncharacterized protein n=1 Tax=Pleurodeles waltl TaxID=8319 RepID=A0AAV7U1U8_PLEWA|nr:hypothetical protein NDU88_008015 [Pleurodeles waltl]